MSPERAEEIFRQIVEQKGLVRRQVVVFDLPTEYIGAKRALRPSQDGEGYEEVIRFNPKVDPSIYRSLRGKFYNILRQTAVRTALGWILIPGADLGKLSAVMAEVNNIIVALGHGDRRIELVEVFLPADWYRREVSRAVDELKADISALAEEAREKAATEREIKRIKKKLRKLKQRLQLLLDELSSLPSPSS